MTEKLFLNFRLFDGLQNKLQERKAIRVVNHRIEEVVDQEEDVIPGIETIDLKGLTLLPGLIDAHVHLTIPLVTEINPKVIMQMNKQIGLNLANCVKYGVTTVRDLGAFSKRMDKWKKKIDSNQVLGPRITTSKSFISCENGVPEAAPTLNPIESLVAGGQFVERVRTSEQARAVANRLIDEGASWIKTQYSEDSLFFHGRTGNLTDESFQALVDVSKERKVGIAMHHTEECGFKKGVQFGFQTLEHCSEEELQPKDIDRFVEKNMGLVPTIKAIGDFMEIEEIRRWLLENGKDDFMPEPYRQSLTGAEVLLTKPYPPSDYKKKFYYDMEGLKSGFPVILENVEKIKKADGRIGVGTDMCGTGLSFFGSYWKELRYLTQAGLSNFEALQSATSVNAELIGMSESVGSVEPGKFADFVLVMGNPLENIEAVRDVEMVIKGGEIVSTTEPAKTN